MSAQAVDSMVPAYHLARWGDSQSWGLCYFVAHGIVSDLGGVIVGGYLNVEHEVMENGYVTDQIPHWWAEVDGETVDPMADVLRDGRLVGRCISPDADPEIGWASCVLEATQRGYSLDALPPPPKFDPLFGAPS